LRIKQYIGKFDETEALLIEYFHKIKLFQMSKKLLIGSCLCSKSATSKACFGLLAALEKVKTVKS